MKRKTQPSTAASPTLDKSQHRVASLLGIFPPLHTLPLALFRALFATMDKLLGLPRLRVNKIVDLTVPFSANYQGKIRVYYPNANPENSSTLIYFHGGGCVIGSIETHDRFCRYLAKHANINIISVAYRRAPEFTFPTQIIDAITTWNWVHTHCETLNLNPNTIGVGGDSAGAYLACLISLLPEQVQLPVQAHVKPTFQFLLYPMVDLQGKSASYLQSNDNLLLTKDLMDYFKSQYLTDEHDARQALISPLQSSHLGHCPKTYLLTVEFDPLRDDGLAFAEKLTHVGCQLQHDHLNDCMHAFISVARISQRARQATHQVAMALHSLTAPK